MEGISGIVSRNETSSSSSNLELAKKLMTEDVNAAIEGAIDAGATTFLVNDAHGVMRNIVMEDLHPSATLIRGWPKPLSQMEGIDKETDAAFFIGYHAKRGTPKALLDHTIDSRIIEDVRLNGLSIGEIGINAMVAGYFGVPVALISGDLAATQEARSLLGEIEFAVVKKATGRYSASCLHPQRAHELIRAAASNAIRKLGEFKPFKPKTPAKLEIDLTETGMADMAELLPVLRRTGARTVCYESENYLDIYRVLRATISLAREIIFENI
jgi:D-amino peptidase